MNINILKFNIAINDLNEISNDLILLVAKEKTQDGFFRCLFNGTENYTKIQPSEERIKYTRNLLKQCNQVTEAGLSDDFLELCVYYLLPCIALDGSNSIREIEEKVKKYEVVISYNPLNDVEWFILECVKYKLLDQYIILTRNLDEDNYQKMKKLTKELDDNIAKYREMTATTFHNYVLR